MVTTDYNQFAILYFKKVHDNQEYIKVILYGGSYTWCDPVLIHAAGEEAHRIQPPGPLHSEPQGGGREVFPQNPS